MVSKIYFSLMQVVATSYLDILTFDPYCLNLVNTVNTGLVNSDSIPRLETNTA